jgi:hypothetical protein
LGTLFWLSKAVKPDEYYNLRVNDSFNDVHEAPIVEITEINQQYLLKKIGDDEYVISDVMKAHLDNLFNSDVKVLNIKSPYGTSKTQLMIKVIEQYNPKRILMLSYRQTLTLDLMKNYEKLGFQNYLTGDINCDRVIMQVESLLKLDTSDIVKQYDLVLIDESDRILNQFSSFNTFNGKEKDTFDYLHQIIDGSKKVICMDGGMTNRTYSFMSNFNKNISIVNTAVVHDNKIAFMDNYQSWKDDIITDLKNN